VLWLNGPDGTLFALAADGQPALGQQRRQDDRPVLRLHPGQHPGGPALNPWFCGRLGG
jgi:hypothetical protein